MNVHHIVAYFISRIRKLLPGLLTSLSSLGDTIEHFPPLMSHKKHPETWHSCCGSQYYTRYTSNYKTFCLLHILQKRITRAFEITSDPFTAILNRIDHWRYRWSRMTKIREATKSVVNNLRIYKEYKIKQASHSVTSSETYCNGNVIKLLYQNFL